MMMMLLMAGTMRKVKVKYFVRGGIFWALRSRWVSNIYVYIVVDLYKCCSSTLYDKSVAIGQSTLCVWKKRKKRKEMKKKKRQQTRKNWMVIWHRVIKHIICYTFVFLLQFFFMLWFLLLFYVLRYSICAQIAHFLCLLVLVLALHILSTWSFACQPTKQPSNQATSLPAYLNPIEEAIIYVRFVDYVTENFKPSFLFRAFLNRQFHICNVCWVCVCV